MSSGQDFFVIRLPPSVPQLRCFYTMKQNTYELNRSEDRKLKSLTPWWGPHATSFGRINTIGFWHSLIGF